MNSDKQKYINLRKKLERVMKEAKHTNAAFQAERNAIVKNIFKHNHKKHFLSWSLDDAALISYYKSETRPYKARYDSQLRTKTRLGRYLTKEFCITNGNLSHWITQIQGKMGSGIVLTERFNTLTGDDITEAYENAVGGSSCMTDEDAIYTEFYAVNPDKVSLLVYTPDPNEGPTARALVWTCDCGTRLMDRIYPNEGKHLAFFEMWASRHNVLVRENNALPVTGQNTHTSKEYKVTMALGDHEYIPYLDTFVTCDKEDEDSVILFNTNYGDMKTDSTKGGPINCMCTCYICGDIVDRDEAFSNEAGEIFCEDCYCDTYRPCEQCDSETERETLVYIEDLEEYWCADCARYHADTCPQCGNTFSDTHLSDNGGLCESCAESYFICDECETVKERYLQNEENPEYCNECAEALGLITEDEEDEEDEDENKTA